MTSTPINFLQYQKGTKRKTVRYKTKRASSKNSVSKQSSRLDTRKHVPLYVICCPFQFRDDVPFVSFPLQWTDCGFCGAGPVFVKKIQDWIREDSRRHCHEKITYHMDLCIYQSLYISLCRYLNSEAVRLKLDLYLPDVRVVSCESGRYLVFIFNMVRFMCPTFWLYAKKNHWGGNVSSLLIVQSTPYFKTTCGCLAHYYKCSSFSRNYSANLLSKKECRWNHRNLSLFKFLWIQ